MFKDIIADLLLFAALALGVGVPAYIHLAALP